MNRQHLFLFSLLNRPQLIWPAAGAAVLHALQPAARLDGYDGPLSGEPARDGDYCVHGDVAVIPVIGKLVHRGAGLNAPSGMCSYQSVEDQICHAVGAGLSVVLDIDSPGGVADGAFALGDRIRELVAQGAVIDAWVAPRALSAGYVIAAACRRICMLTDAEVGSIGVAWYHADFSRQIEEDGITVTHFFRGARKLDGASTMPLTDGARAAFDAAMDNTYDRFVRFVADCRNMEEDTVRATEAAIFPTADAMRMGLADETYPNLKDMIMSVSNARLNQGNPPPGNPPAALPDVPELAAAAVASTLTAAGYPGLIAGMLAAGAVTEASLKARIDAANAIKEMCGQVGVPEMAAPLIDGGMSLEGARAIALAAKAGREAVQPVDATQRATGNKPAPVLDHSAIYARMNNPG